ncbi:uncharacterized protein [Panulirus ornatus]|uniref:uncharacterized protein n=1 Tax=Panulirus ornatus TaxID=150431 RepID=UPI003A8C259A
MCQTYEASDSWFQVSPTSLQFPPDSNRQHRRLSLQAERPIAVLNQAYTSLQQQAPQTSRIVIIAKNVDPSCSFVKEVDVGNTVICYVPRNVVFSEDSNFFDTVNDIVHVKCSQTDVNFSMALLCKPQQLPENCLTVWTVDDRIRRNAMWSSPEYGNFKNEKPQTSVIAPWFRGRSVKKGRLLHPSSRGPVTTGPVYHSTKSGSKKYQGRVPSIVALLTSHAKSQYKTQKSTVQPDDQLPVPKTLEDSQSGTEKGFWQQKRFAPVSQEIHKALTRESEHRQEDSDTLRKDQGEVCVIDPVMEKIDIMNKGKGYGFSYHLDPPTTTRQLRRPSVLHLPPPPQMPLPPVPEVHDPAEPGPSSRSDIFSPPGKPAVPWKEMPPLVSTSPKGHEICQPVAYKAQRISESVTFVNPYTQQVEYEPSLKESKADDTIVTPHSEKERSESTCLIIPEEVIKPHHVNKQKLSAVLVLSLFVVSLIIFYLVYFL